MSSRPLDKTAILVLDFQATAAASRRGLLIEAAWACWRPVSSSLAKLEEVESHFVRLPAGFACPAGVRRVTGLSEEELSRGLESPQLANRLRSALNRLPSGNGAGPPLVVIHYARFERPFLAELLDLEPFSRWPLELVCTHEIARRLYAFLPRRGLRALAGYLGHSTPELRRSLDHVRATAVVWSKSVEELSREGVRTLSDLRRWLLQVSPRGRQPRRYPMPSLQRLALEDRPGVYHLLRSNGDVLYVGKTGSLKRRVNSYFQKRWKGNERALELLSQVQRVEVISTPTCFQAALLEVQHIQRLRPPYNVALRSKQRRLLRLDRDLRTAPAAASRAGLGGWTVLREDNPLLLLLPVVAALLCSPPRIVDWPPALRRPERWQEAAAEFLSRCKPLLRSRRLEGRLRRVTLNLQARGETFNTGAGVLESPSPQRTLYSEVGWADREPDRLDPGSTGDPVESAIGLLEKTAAWADRMLSRSRWLGHLQNSEICWPSGDRLIRVSVKEGVVLLAPEFGTAAAGLDGGPRTRWPSVMSYDQLRVLTSEIRRGVGRGRDVRVRLHARTELKGRPLAEVLRWV